MHKPNIIATALGFVSMAAAVALAGQPRMKGELIAVW
jgi:hypothetical protein